MKNKYIFVGKDGSEGYINGKEYVLQLIPSSDGMNFWIRPCFNNYDSLRSSNAKSCLYSSMKAFEKNWILSQKNKRVFSTIDPYGEENWD